VGKVEGAAPNGDGTGFGAATKPAGELPNTFWLAGLGGGKPPPPNIDREEGGGGVARREMSKRGTELMSLEFSFEDAQK